MQNYLEKTNISKFDQELKDYSLSNNNIDDEYVGILKGMSMAKITELINKYPDYRYVELTNSIKKEFNVNNVVLGCGSEDLIIRVNTALRERGKIVIFTPNFYRIAETAGDYKQVRIDYNVKSEFVDFGKTTFDKGVKGVWISNPNPMIGKIYKKSGLLRLINKYKKIIFVVDESTIDFNDKSNKQSVISAAQRLNNLIVIRSFSKLYGTAGLRVGFATGKTKLLKEVEKLGLTFPVNGVAEYFIKTVLKNKSTITNIRKRICKHKASLEKLLLSNKNIILSRSVTNCVFFKHKKINIFEELLKMNILALNMDDQYDRNNKGFVRITVHTSKNLFNNLCSCLSVLFKKYEKRF